MPQLCAKSSSLKIRGRHLTVLQSAQGQNFFHFVKSDSYTDGMRSYHHVSRNRVDCLENTLWLFRTEKGRGVGKLEEKGRETSGISSCVSLFCMNGSSCRFNHRSTSNTQSWGSRNSVSLGWAESHSYFQHLPDSCSKPSVFSSPFFIQPFPLPPGENEEHEGAVT